MFRAIVSGGSSFICRTRFIAPCGIRRRSLVLAPGLSGSYNASFVITGFGSSRDGWLALVGGGTQCGITAGCLNVLRLRGYGTDMVLVSVGLFLRCGPRFHPTASTVVADVSFGDIRHRSVVGVVNDGGVYVIHVSIVGEVATFPAAPLITDAAVAEAIIDAAIEAHLWPPISFVEKERALAPAPITGRPEKADLRCFHPRTGHPVVAILLVIRPVAGCPKVAVGGTDWLLVDRKRRWTEVHGNADTDLSECTVRENQQDKRKQQRTNSNRSTHCASSCLLILTYYPVRRKAHGRGFRRRHVGARIPPRRWPSLCTTAHFSICRK